MRKLFLKKAKKKKTGRSALQIDGAANADAATLPNVKDEKPVVEDEIRDATVVKQLKSDEVKEERRKIPPPTPGDPTPTPGTPKIEKTKKRSKKQLASRKATNKEKKTTKKKDVKNEEKREPKSGKDSDLKSSLAVVEAAVDDSENVSAGINVSEKKVNKRVDNKTKPAKKKGSPTEKSKDNGSNKKPTKRSKSKPKPKKSKSEPGTTEDALRNQSTAQLSPKATKKKTSKIDAKGQSKEPLEVEQKAGSKVERSPRSRRISRKPRSSRGKSATNKKRWTIKVTPPTSPSNLTSPTSEKSGKTFKVDNRTKAKRAPRITTSTIREDVEEDEHVASVFELLPAAASERQVSGLTREVSTGSGLTRKLSEVLSGKKSAHEAETLDHHVPQEEDQQEKPLDPIAVNDNVDVVVDDFVTIVTETNNEVGQWCAGGGGLCSLTCWDHDSNIDYDCDENEMEGSSHKRNDKIGDFIGDGSGSVDDKEMVENDNVNGSTFDNSTEDGTEMQKEARRRNCKFKHGTYSGSSSFFTSYASNILNSTSMSMDTNGSSTTGGSATTTTTTASASMYSTSGSSATPSIEEDLTGEGGTSLREVDTGVSSSLNSSMPNASNDPAAMSNDGGPQVKKRSDDAGIDSTRSELTNTPKKRYAVMAVVEKIEKRLGARSPSHLIAEKPPLAPTPDNIISPPSPEIKRTPMIKERPIKSGSILNSQSQSSVPSSSAMGSSTKKALLGPQIAIKSVARSRTHALQSHVPPPVLQKVRTVSPAIPPSGVVQKVPRTVSPSKQTPKGTLQKVRTISPSIPLKGPQKVRSMSPVHLPKGTRAPSPTFRAARAAREEARTVRSSPSAYIKRTNWRPGSPRSGLGVFDKMLAIKEKKTTVVPTSAIVQEVIEKETDAALAEEETVVNTDQKLLNEQPKCTVIEENTTSVEVSVPEEGREAGQSVREGGGEARESIFEGGGEARESVPFPDLGVESKRDANQNSENFSISNLSTATDALMDQAQELIGF
ncbi:hypothetical protein ACHAWF_013055 [Thalassiosira exigua]